MALVSKDYLIEQMADWYWQNDKQELSKDPCVIDAMIDLFIRTIQNAPEIIVDNYNRDKGKWVAMSNMITPGGDPCYECSNCHNGHHIHGVEYQEHWEYCPDCGSHNGYEGSN